jgi:alpha-amylase/alpha-mannosidase (GH57 family)
LTARSVVIHGHFYQPPREDPWLDEIEAEPSAAPFHDWNERIERECYRAVVAARQYAPDGRIARIVNTLASISFDFGPTLLEWLEREAPETYAAVLEGDRLSRERHEGHGNAIAMPYHHAILPLASRRDKVTEVHWGIADFRRRFGREPVGMWLPETAVDPETLDVLAALDIRFTVLAPHQVERPRARGLPGWYRTPGGRRIAVFLYDGAISHDVAFGPLLKNAAQWVERLLAVDKSGVRPELVAVATDGETYGHHHRFGEVALAWLLDSLGRRADVRVENFAAFLARHPPEEELRLVAPTSWSCPHGVERWRADCGCRLAPERPTQQRWRAPLREALEWLAHELHARFEREGAELFADPWAARDAYGVVVSSDGASIARFAAERMRRPDDPAARVRAQELLELERNALRMFTSCGWFFDDIGGIETVQILRYAARAIELGGGGGDAPRLEEGVLERLARAESNEAGAGSGRDVYLNRVKPRIPAPARVAAGYAAVRRFAPRAEEARGGCYVVRDREDRVLLTHCRTGREHEFRVAVGQVDGSRPTIDVVSAEGAAPLRLGLADLPERHRLPIVAALREQLLARTLAPEQATLLATGGADLTHVAGRALLGAVAALEHDQSPRAIGTVMDLADLLQLDGGHIPFDVQTTFYRLRGASSPERAAQLAPVARRLGFADGRAGAGGGGGGD